jgi:phosphate transport system permease protein
MEKSLNWREYIITRLIRVSGYSAIVFVAAIFFFLLREGLPALAEVKLGDLLAVRWYPIENYFGILPLITGSVIITVGALVIAFPFGIATAIFISEIAPRWVREILKPLVELLAGLPSVVLGFLGILVLAPFLRRFLDLPTGLTALAGSILLGGIAVPTIVSIAEDALDSVPRSYREGAWALGATMTVMMVTGNAPVLAIKLGSLFSPVRTMTATIAAEMGEVASGSTHYHVLFFIGIVLFLISLAVNVAASSLVFRARKRAERILS